MFVDGFNVAKQVHENHPDAFDVLKNFHVRFSDYGTDAFGEFAFGHSRPLIGYVLHVQRWFHLQQNFFDSFVKLLREFTFEHKTN